MRISVFIYIASIILFVQVLALDNTLLTQIIHLLCIIGILTFGVSHGAIDDILYKKNNNSISKANFVLKYLIAFVSYFIFSILFPNIAVILFLMLSGFHFGQAQFAPYKFRSNKINLVMNGSWGAMILLLLFHFNKDILIESTSNFTAIPASLTWMFLNSTILLIVCSIIFSSILLIKFLKKELKLEAILFELFLIGVIAASFTVLDPFIAFSLFFVIIHSIEALTHELNYFKTSLGITKLRNFIASLIPFTVISLVGIGLLLTLMSFLGYYNYIPLVSLILIASITAPHSFIMNKFYTTEKS